MDILSHGLWGGIMFGRQNGKSFWLSFRFGIGPDLLSFGIFTAHRLISALLSGSLFSGSFGMHAGKPELAHIPAYVSHLYDITHSFVIFIIVFAIVWFFLKRPLWIMLAWPFHIFLDLFTHSTSFFPTPYLWPLPFTPINGISWSTPIIFFTNAGFLILIYAVYWYRKKRYPKDKI